MYIRSNEPCELTTDVRFYGAELFAKYFLADWQSLKLSRIEKLNPDNIEKVIFNPPATIIIFKDGTKEIVKCTKGDEYTPEVGFAMAIMNIIFGSRSEFKRFIEKYEGESFKDKK